MVQYQKRCNKRSTDEIGAKTINENVWKLPYYVIKTSSLDVECNYFTLLKLLVMLTAAKMCYLNCILDKIGMDP